MKKDNIHILRYGTVAENDYLKKAVNCYDYLAINGNSAAHVPSAISKFIVNNFFSNNDKGYFIDPITYAFQGDLKYICSDHESSIKKSFKKLIGYYKEPIDKVETFARIKPSDFSKEDVCLSFCERVLFFQESLVSHYIEDNGLMEYIMYVAKDASKYIKPKFLIAPYFYLDSDNKDFYEWLKLNITLFNYSIPISRKYDIPLFCQILINKSVLLDDSIIEEIGKRYKDLDCNGYTIWIGGLDEHIASIRELKGYMKLLSFLKNKPVYSMYSGYFSTLLTNKKISLLSGISYGLEYGENREVYPVGGGIPVSKYYYMPIHKRLDFTKAFYLLDHRNIINENLNDLGDSKQYYKEICDCKQCKDLLGSSMKNIINYENTEYYDVKIRNTTIRRKKPSKNTKQICLFHYLLCKEKEFKESHSKDISVLTKELKTQYNNYASCNYIDDNELDYLRDWAKVIEEYIDEQ